MSAEYPIVAITGSSGVVSEAIIKALEHVFWRTRVKAVYIQGDAFYRYDRVTMRQEMSKARANGHILSHYHPNANHLDKLESLFFEYAATGRGMYRHYLRTAKLAARYGQAAGTFTPWQAMAADSDLLLYRGLHGAAKVDDIDISQYPDLLLGIAPNANMEWLRKLQRDKKLHGCSTQDVKNVVMEHLHDYLTYISPQFSRTHINFQMIPVVDTSDPFGYEEVPDIYECYLVIRFQRGYRPDFTHFIKGIPGAFMSRHNTLVVPGSKILNVVELILLPLINDLIAKSRELRQITDVPKDRGAGLLGIAEESILQT